VRAASILRLRVRITGEAGIMQQGSETYNLQVCRLRMRKALCHVINTQDVVEAMNGILLRIPGTGSFKRNHRRTSGTADPAQENIQHPGSHDQAATAAHHAARQPEDNPQHYPKDEQNCKSQHDLGPVYISHKEQPFQASTRTRMRAAYLSTTDGRASRRQQPAAKGETWVQHGRAWTDYATRKPVA